MALWLLVGPTHTCPATSFPMHRPLAPCPPPPSPHCHPTPSPPPSLPRTRGCLSPSPHSTPHCPLPFAFTIPFLGPMFCPHMPAHPCPSAHLLPAACCAPPPARCHAPMGTHAPPAWHLNFTTALPPLNYHHPAIHVCSWAASGSGGSGHGAR